MRHKNILQSLQHLLFCLSFLFSQQSLAFLSPWKEIYFCNTQDQGTIVIDRAQDYQTHEYAYQLVIKDNTFAVQYFSSLIGLGGHLRWISDSKLVVPGLVKPELSSFLHVSENYLFTAFISDNSFLIANRLVTVWKDSRPGRVGTLLIEVFEGSQQSAESPVEISKKIGDHRYYCK